MLSPRPGLVLELGHAPELAHVGERVEDPGELGVLRHVRLHEDDRPLGVDAAGDVGGWPRRSCCAELGGLLSHRDGVQVDDAEVVVVLSWISTQLRMAPR